MNVAYALSFALFLFLVSVFTTNKETINEKSKRNFWILAGLFGVYSVVRFILA
ncbi:hypothetical protein [Bacillus toyonensis]|uniref:hypothetical protein n=1 Tax=Bacillus toyonensis TaxID=155322 RepID=UPI0015D4A30F|nr:hypothetical protein [Bacillus toyonensis]